MKTEGLGGESETKEGRHRDGLFREKWPTQGSSGAQLTEPGRMAALLEVCRATSRRLQETGL